jgi:universal stress protein A
MTSAQQVNDYQRILAAIDVGSEAEQIMRRAEGVAPICSASLAALHVVDHLPDYDPDFISILPAQEIEAELVAAARRRIADLPEPATRECVETVILSGRAREVIPQIAQERQADLIVLGSYRWHGIGRPLGSTADRLLHRAPCDVLVVRIKPREEAGALKSAYAHILIAADFSKEGAKAARRGAHLAHHYNARLTLLHVVEHFPVDRSNELIAPEDKDPAMYHQQHAQEALAQLAADIGWAYAEQEVVLSPRGAEHEIPRLAERGGADLIVLGSHGMHGLQTLLGSTADGVLPRTNCDVLVVRAGG